MLGGHVALLLGVDEVERWHRLHAQFGGVVAGEVLGLVGAVEILAGQGGFAARHVAADDEVAAAVVLADDHVLQGLPGAGHVHGVGQVGPADARVGHLGGQALVGGEAHLAGDVVLLGGATGGMHQHHRLAADVGGLEGPGEEFVVGPVDGVAALEGHHVLSRRQGGAHLGGSPAGEHPPRQGQALEAPAQVIATPLGGDHAHRRMLQGGGAVAAPGLHHLVGLPAALDGEHRQVLALIGQQQALTHRDLLVVGVEDDRQAEEQAAGGAVVRHHGLVILLMHEAAQGGEAPHDQQLDVAGIAVAALHHPVHRGTGRLMHLGSLVLGNHQVDEGAAVGIDQGGGAGGMAGVAGGAVGDRHGDGPGAFGTISPFSQTAPR